MFLTSGIFDRIITLLETFKFVIKYKKAILLLLGCFFQSGVSLIALGKLILFSEFMYYTIATAFITTIFDLVIILIFKKILKSYSQKVVNSPESRLMLFCKHHSTLGTIFYRFIPFSRIPFLATSSVVINIKNVLFPNFIGGILWSFCWIYIGHNRLSKIIMSRLYSFFR